MAITVTGTPVFREIAAEVGLDFYYFNGATGEYYLPEIMGGLLFSITTNDGYLDIYLIQGTDLGGNNKWLSPPPPGWKTGNQLLRNMLAETGKLQFVDITEQAGVGHVGYGMGFASGDIDNDGAIDIVVTNNNGPVRLLQNQIGSRHYWLQVRLERVDSTCFGIRAHVGVLRQGKDLLWRRVHTDGSSLSSSDVRVHLGLGDDLDIDSVTVKWPHGGVENWHGIRADRVVKLLERVQEILHERG